MAERTPVVKKYRDALETVISATMEFMSRPSDMEQRAIDSRDDHDVVQSFLGLSAQQSPDQMKLPNLKRSLAFSDDDNGGGRRSGSGSGYVASRVGHRERILSPSGASEGYDDSRQPYERLNGGVGSASSSSRDWEGPPQPSQQQPEMHHQMDEEWLLSLCEGDEFSWHKLNEMMRLEPSLGA